MCTDLAGAALQDHIISEAKQCKELPADAGDQQKPVDGGAGTAADSAYASPATQEAVSAAKASPDDAKALPDNAKALPDEQRASGADEPDAGDCCCLLLSDLQVAI